MYDVLIDRIKVMGAFRENPLLISSTHHRLEYEFIAVNPNVTSIASIVTNLIGSKYSDELVDCKNAKSVSLKQSRVIINNELVNSFIEVNRISNTIYRAIIQVVNKVKIDSLGQEILEY